MYRTGSVSVYLKTIILIGLFCGMLLSPLLWIPHDGVFPQLPFLDHLPAFNGLTSVVLLVLFGIGSTLWIGAATRFSGHIAVLCLLLLLLQDQMRWQPWVYLYLLLLMPFLQRPGNKEDTRAISCLQLLIPGVYVWSGIHKLHTGFIEGTFTFFFEALSGMLPGKYACLGYSIPLFEILTGIALLYPATRKAGMLMAILTHITILLLLTFATTRHNWVIFPWNVTLILLIVLLYGPRSEKRGLHRGMIRHPRYILPLLQVWIMPVFNFRGYWDHFLSFSFYSDKPAHFYIAVEESQVNKIDKRLQDYFVPLPGMEGGRIIDIEAWSFAALNVPFNPEDRIFQKLIKRFDSTGIPRDKLVFIAQYVQDGIPQFRTFP